MKALADESDALIEGNKTLAAEIKAVSAGGASPRACTPKKMLTTTGRAGEDTSRTDGR